MCIYRLCAYLIAFGSWCAISLFEVRSGLIPSVPIVCIKCALVKSASSVHTVCIKCTSIHEKKTSSDPFWQSCLGRSWDSKALKPRQTSRRYPPSYGPQVSVPWMLSNARYNTAKTRAEKTNPSDPFWHCCCGRSKALKAPKLRQISRSYPPPHVPKASAPWIHSNKHHNTANMGAVMNNLSDLGRFH